jgi:hypothetical protein
MHDKLLGTLSFHLSLIQSFLLSDNIDPHLLHINPNQPDNFAVKETRGKHEIDKLKI